MKMSGFTLQKLESKLGAVNSSQEGIQGFSHWIIQNKDHHDIIVRHWLRALKEAQKPHRLTLFYVANDVVQNCRRKKADVYREAFKPALTEAVTYVRDVEIVNKVERLLTIWDERSVYDAQFLTELKQILVDRKAIVVDASIVETFQPRKVMQLLRSKKRLSSENEAQVSQLKQLKVEAVCTEDIKDREEGQRLCDEFDGSYNRLLRLVVGLQDEIDTQHKLTDWLERSRVYYEAQFGDAKVVAHAYKNFGAKVQNLKNKLEHVLLDKFPDRLPTPEYDAPSPALSGEALTPPPVFVSEKDDVVAVDMDLSDEEDRIAVLGHHMHGHQGSSLGRFDPRRRLPVPPPPPPPLEEPVPQGDATPVRDERYDNDPDPEPSLPMHSFMNLSKHSSRGGANLVNLRMDEDPLPDVPPPPAPPLLETLSESSPKMDAMPIPTVLCQPRHSAINQHFIRPTGPRRPSRTLSPVRTEFRPPPRSPGLLPTPPARPFFRQPTFSPRF